jgi:outer membrane protein TolC
VLALVLVPLFLLLPAPVPAAGSDPGASGLDLATAQRLALGDDPGADVFRARARAARERAVADAQLPDPVVSMGALNFPVDSFAFDQERMTQLRLGVRQQFPGGDTLARRRALGEARAGGFDAATELRRREVLRAVRIAWLDLRWLEQERTLLEDTLPLLEDLEETALAGYRQGAGDQQGVLRARLEQDSLRDRLLRNREELERVRAELVRWVGPAAEGARTAGDLMGSGLAGAASFEQLRERLGAHPLLDMRQAEIEAARAEIGLAEAAYRPDWGIELGYGVRDGLEPMGDTPDFVSAALTFELPLFTADRQDRRRSAAESSFEAARAERLDSLRELTRDLQRTLARLDRLEDRMELFDGSILPRAAQTAEAARRGYRADTTDFPETVRTALAQLDARIERARIVHERASARARLAWLIGDEVAAGPAPATTTTEEQVR